MLLLIDRMYLNIVMSDDDYIHFDARSQYPNKFPDK